MSTRGYTLLGWIVWSVLTWAAKFWIRQNKAKVGAAGVVGLVLIGGIVAAAKSGSGDDS
jgi:hypothetical protein